MKRFPAGRINEAPSTGLSTSLRSAGFKLGRLQTGTPARLDRNTIDFSNMQRQDGDVVPSPFSFMHRTVDNAVSANHAFLLYSEPEGLRYYIGQPICLLPDSYYTRHSSNSQR